VLSPTGQVSPRPSHTCGLGTPSSCGGWTGWDGHFKHLIETVTALSDRGVGFRSLQEQIDTTTSGGKLIFHVFGALAEFERDIIRERTHAGLAAARARGRLFGRPRVLTTQQVKQLRSLAQDDRNTVSEICHTLGISRATFYRYLK
jgi:DNA invertase Pin-like site-specific DNA recombinase